VKTGEMEFCMVEIRGFSASRGWRGRDLELVRVRDSEMLSFVESCFGNLDPTMGRDVEIWNVVGFEMRRFEPWWG
jgi:hypothetical protein